MAKLSTFLRLYTYLVGKVQKFKVSGSRTANWEFLATTLVKNPFQQMYGRQKEDIFPKKRCFLWVVFLYNDPPVDSFFPYPEDPWDWYIYLHGWLTFMGNIGKYTIHGSSGIGCSTSLFFFVCSWCFCYSGSFWFLKAMRQCGMRINHRTSIDINPTASDLSRDIMWITNLIATPPKTISWPLKHGGWKMFFPFVTAFFQGANC